MARALWKGAITFGLVHMPVALFSATRDSSIDFQWLDRRSLDPVGYKRYNKRTGRELKMQDIVKGVRQPDGRYIVITDEEVRAAFPKSTQTIEIDSFVKMAELPLLLLERPYYLQPAAKAERVCTCCCAKPCALRMWQASRASSIHNKEHLAAVMVIDDVLVLDVLRWAEDLRLLEARLSCPPVAQARLPGPQNYTWRVSSSER